MSHKTDVIIIGAGPVGLFAVFELGLLNLKCHLVDNLDKVGGQCSELYPEKHIYDIPAYPTITGQELTDNLILQIKPFEPVFHLNQQAENIKKVEGGWMLTTSQNIIIEAKCIVVAAGAGSFVSRKPPLENIAEFENKSIFYAIRDKSKFKGKKIIIAGGGDSALDWTNDLASIASSNSTTVVSAQKATMANLSVQGIGYEPELVGSIFGTDVNSISAPITGNNAVYVVEVIAIDDEKLEGNFSQQKTNIVNQASSAANGQSYNALKETANVQDNRSDFY